MPFTIPNLANATFPSQAEVDKVDWDIVVAGDSGTGVVSGCAVSSTGAANGSLTVTSGVVRTIDLLGTCAGGTVAITANSSGNPRYDLIVSSSTGVLSAVAGTPAASPVFPSIPASSVVLAAMYVANGHTATTTINNNTLTDKRVNVSDRADAGTVAGATFESRFQHKDPSKIALYVKGVIDPSAFLKPIFQVDDYQAAPIFWVAPVGGTYVTDDMQTAYTVFGPYYSRFDVYGYQYRNTQCTYAFAGPPGNMLSFTDACHEIYQSTRLPTVGAWGVVAACTLGTIDLGAPPTGSPTGYRSALVITSTTGGTAWVSTPGGASAYDGANAGDIISAVFWMRSGTIAAARTAQVRLSWFNAAGTQVGSDITSAGTSIPNTGVWTRVFLTGQTVPATATRFQIHILVQAMVTGETVRVAGVGVMRGDNDGIFAPPFWGQEISGTGKVGGAALKGDRWIRTDLGDVPGSREYVCRVGGAPRFQYWDPIDTSTVIRLRADQAFSTTSLANVNSFSFNVLSTRQYQMDISLIFTSAATTTGWQVGFTGPAMSSFISVCEYESSATAWTKDKIAAIGSHAATAATYAAGTLIMMRIRAHFIPSANGTIQFQMRSSVAASAITAKNGSTFTVT